MFLTCLNRLKTLRLNRTISPRGTPDGRHCAASLFGKYSTRAPYSLSFIQRLVLGCHMMAAFPEHNDHL